MTKRTRHNGILVTSKILNQQTVAINEQFKTEIKLDYCNDTHEQEVCVFPKYFVNRIMNNLMYEFPTDKLFNPVYI